MLNAEKIVNGRTLLFLAAGVVSVVVLTMTFGLCNGLLANLQAGSSPQRMFFLTRWVHLASGYPVTPYALVLAAFSVSHILSKRESARRGYHAALVLNGVFILVVVMLVVFMALFFCRSCLFEAG